MTIAKKRAGSRERAQDMYSVLCAGAESQCILKKFKNFPSKIQKFSLQNSNFTTRNFLKKSYTNFKSKVTFTLLYKKQVKKSDQG